MLLTVTLNAAIDKTYTLACANTPGDVLRVQDMQATPGGKGINVAKAATALGQRVMATGFLGGHAGRWVQEQLTAEGILCDAQPVPGQTRTCINIVEPDGRQTEFLEPGPEISAEALNDFLVRFERLAREACAVTMSGSLPRGVPDDIYAQLIAICKRLGRPALLDTSGAPLQQGIRALPDVIKPNLQELGQLMGRPIACETADVLACAQALQATGIGLVVVSLGAKGAVAVTRDAAFHVIPPQIEAVSATGSGDSFLAGLAVGMLRGQTLSDTLRLATAAAAANALNIETGRVHIEDVHALLPQVKLRQIPAW